MKEKLVEKIHDILGIMDPPELRDIKTERIIILIAQVINNMLYENTQCSPMCDGWHKFENTLSDLLDDKDKAAEAYHCIHCMAMFKEECVCNEQDNENLY